MNKLMICQDTSDQILRTEFQESRLFKILPADIDYGILIFQQKDREFFPGYQLPFILQRNGMNPVSARVTSAPAGTREGDPNAGNYITGKLGEWYRHNQVYTGSKVRVSKFIKVGREDHNFFYRISRA